MRDYDPEMGRYLQPDPLGLVDGAALYNYARQNPAVYTDFTGKCPMRAAPLIWGAITGGSGTGIFAGAGTGLAIALGIGVAISPSSAGDGTLGPDATRDDGTGQCDDPCKKERENLDRAKKGNPGKCLPSDSKATPEYKYNRARDLLKARMEAFLCFADNDPTHKDEIRKVREVLRECARRLGR